MTREERAALEAAVDYYDTVRGQGAPGRLNMREAGDALFMALDALHAAAGGRWNGPAHTADCALMQSVKTEFTGDGHRLLEVPTLIKCTCGSNEE